MKQILHINLFKRSVFGVEKILFSLHFTMFKDTLKVWATPEQSKYFEDLVNQNAVFGTYVQTEIGHGTYLRGEHFIYKQLIISEFKSMIYLKRSRNHGNI